LLRGARRDRLRADPGGDLQVKTTICHEIRHGGEAVVIDSVTDDLSSCSPN
jgi:hypothetical protein